jgi:hypothetical protein
MLRILWRIWGRLWIGSDLEKTCPAGRASGAEGGHFVAGIPVEEGHFLWSDRWSGVNIARARVCVNVIHV